MRYHLSEMQPTHDVIQFYDDFAEKYDETVFQQKDYTAFQKIPSWLLAVLKQEALICDLGCGTGLGSKALIEKGFAVTGVDISPKMVEQAQKLGFKKLICQSLEKPLPFAENAFDGALMLGVMEFIENPSVLFKEIARILKPGAFFGLTIPQKNAHEKELGIFSFQRDQMELALKGQFKIVKQEAFQGFIYKEKTVIYSGYLLEKL